MTEALDIYETKTDGTVKLSRFNKFCIECKTYGPGYKFVDGCPACGNKELETQGKVWDDARSGRR